MSRPGSPNHTAEWKRYRGGDGRISKFRDDQEKGKVEVGYEAKLEKYKQRKTTRMQESKGGGNRREEKVERLRWQ